MNKFLLLLIWIIIMINPIHGQEPDSIYKSTQNKSYYKNYLGISSGFTTGVGFSYRYWPGKKGIQITLLPLYDKNITVISFGLTYLKEIREFNSSRFLFYASNHITNMFNDNSFIDNIGIGMGIDYNYNDFILNFMVGYAGIDLFDDFKTRPSIELGVFYNF